MEDSSSTAGSHTEPLMHVAKAKRYTQSVQGERIMLLGRNITGINLPN